jgi:general secretion pathway protein M
MMRLTPREKLLALALAVFVAVWALFAFAVNPAVGRIEMLSRLIPEKQNELRKLTAMSKEYILLRESLDRLRAKVASQQNGFELLPFLETLVRESGLEKKVAAMKQQVVPLDSSYYETIVEVKLQNLTLSQLVDFLCKAESSPVLVKTKTLHIRRNVTNPDLLDSVVEIHSAKLTQSQVARM